MILLTKSQKVQPNSQPLAYHSYEEPDHESSLAFLAALFVTIAPVSDLTHCLPPTFL
jgi:hypothetical protein